MKTRISYHTITEFSGCFGQGSNPGRRRFFLDVDLKAEIDFTWSQSSRSALIVRLLIYNPEYLEQPKFRKMLGLKNYNGEITIFEKSIFESKPTPVMFLSDDLYLKG